MTDLTLYGSPFSNFVRSARLALEEKGVAYTLDPANTKDPEYRRLHPFARMPALRHVDFQLGESMAIMRYVDEAFDGPSLQPVDVRARARMTQWISVFNDYVVAVIGRRILAECYATALFGRPTNEATIEAALPDARHQLNVLDGILAENPFLVGDRLSLADLMFLPHIFYLAKTPETEALLKPVAHVRRWHESMSGRPSVRTTEPPIHELRVS